MEFKPNIQLFANAVVPDQAHGIGGRRDLDRVWDYLGISATAVQAMTGLQFGNVLYIQDKGQKDENKVYIDKLNGKLYICKTYTNTTSNSNDIFEEINLAQIYNRLKYLVLVEKNFSIMRIGDSVGSKFKGNRFRFKISFMGESNGRAWLNVRNLELRISADYSWNIFAGTLLFNIAAYIDKKMSPVDVRTHHKSIEVIEDSRARKDKNFGYKLIVDTSGLWLDFYYKNGTQDFQCTFTTRQPVIMHYIDYVDTLTVDTSDPEIQWV